MLLVITFSRNLSMSWGMDWEMVENRLFVVWHSSRFGHTRFLGGLCSGQQWLKM
jgi:hypothetical protein